jgi:beta-N-acetylhexosaminidase
MDMLCIGNNLLDQEQEMAGVAASIQQSLHDGTWGVSAAEASIERCGNERRF